MGIKAMIGTAALAAVCLYQLPGFSERMYMKMHNPIKDKITGKKEYRTSESLFEVRRTSGQPKGVPGLQSEDYPIITEVPTNEHYIGKVAGLLLGAGVVLTAACYAKKKINE